jgi:cytochrome subunit of sulfide dehydrogenase
MNHLPTPSRRPRPIWVLAAASVLLAAGSWLGLAPSQAEAPSPATPPLVLVPAAAAASHASASGEAMAHTCAACHGTNGQLGDEAFVPLAGLPHTQFVRTMQQLRSGERPSTLMGHVAQGFSDADLLAMGRFFEAIPPLPQPETTR